jgi:hypothetical protein
MWVQKESALDTTHCALTQSTVFCHLVRAPICSIPRRQLKRLGNQLFCVDIDNPPGNARAIEQTIQTIPNESNSPLSNRLEVMCKVVATTKLNFHSAHLSTKRTR